MAWKTLMKNDKSEDSLDARCEELEMINGLLRGMREKRNFEYTCTDPRTAEAHRWRLRECGEFSAFCIDCDNVCTTCPGGSFLISPCPACAILS